MADIQVVFPSQGRPIVCCERKATLWDEQITWHIHNENPSVKKVRIDFQRPGAKFFPDSTIGAPQNSFEKELDGAHTINIWGVAPNNGPATSPTDPNRRKLDKYTIQGICAAGQVVSELDPQIVNSDPNDP